MGYRDPMPHGDRLKEKARASGLPEPPIVTADAVPNANPDQRRRHLWEPVDVFTAAAQEGLQHHILLRCPRCGQYWARVWNHRA